MKAYFWKEDKDSDSCVAVIADNSKEAKEIGSSWWGKEVGHNESDWYIQQRVNLVKDKDINIKGLSKGVIKAKEGMRRGIYGWVEDNCDRCKKYGTLTNVLTDTNQCICSDCEEEVNS